MNFNRMAGVLLHPTSLPGKYGIGSLGKEAIKFIDFLSNANQKLWQIFPLGPTGYGDSPYQCFSAFAGNPLLIDLDQLVDYGLIKKIATTEKFNKNSIEYGKVINFKYDILKRAFKNFDLEDNEYAEFVRINISWLDDYAKFMAFKDYYKGKPWTSWESKIRDREATDMALLIDKLHIEIDFYKFIQFIFFKQWNNIKKYANDKGISIIGDIPIFVSMDSSDCWANPELFLFDKDKKPIKVAGVPPDYFSKTGQLWGNPLYNWDLMNQNGFIWWIERIKNNLNICDIIRIDHFRGFEAYWAVPHGEKTAINGQWVKAPGYELFQAVKNALGDIPIIAEDLGIITKEVDDLRNHFGFPGMKVLQFAFDINSESNHLPHHYHKNSVCYTGTHDNDTTISWFNSLNKDEKELVKTYNKYSGDICYDMIHTAYVSHADIVITPLQDILNIEDGRMNTPGKASGNWQWRFSKGLTKTISNKLNKLVKMTYR